MLGVQGLGFRGVRVWVSEWGLCHPSAAVLSQLSMRAFLLVRVQGLLLGVWDLGFRGVRV